MSHRIAILDGYRTPFVKAAGPLKGLGADDLGAVVVRELLARTGIGPAEVDEVIFGNVAQPIHAPNIARVIALKAGIPQTTIAHTVHRNCASGMQSITTAALEIVSGRADIVVAGGTESMSQVPLMVGAKMTEILVRLMRARTLGQRMKAIASIRPAYLRPVIALELALTDPIVGLNMGQTAEVLAREFAVSRREQDELAQLRSHRLAAAAMEAGRLDEEIIPITVAPSYRTIVTHDIGPDGDISLEALGRRRPYFDRQAGTVTVGNSCPITDGAAAVVLCSEQKAKQLGVTPLGYLDRWAYAALDGKRMGLGPVYATSRLCAESGLKMKDFDLVELNEAFAAQVIANERAFASETFAREHLDRGKCLGAIDRDRLNVNGGAIALGHPVGASGTRLVVTLLRELARRGLHRGLATLCVGGGQGAALSLEAA